jgi:hypothetical protein
MSVLTSLHVMFHLSFDMICISMQNLLAVHLMHIDSLIVLANKIISG